MKYVACYCRVSTDEQAKFGFSIQAQKDALKKYCKDNNYKYEFYIDEGISASSMKRPALKSMLSKVNVFDMVLFTKLDRLSRNVLDANNINKLLIDNNCTMKAIDEDDIDTSTADGTFIFNLKVSLAQREIGKTSERIKFVFQNKRNKGEITSGTKKYGYDIIDKHFVVNIDQQENIIKFYEYFINVGADTKLSFEYFKDHFPFKSYDAYKKMLTETSYIGKYKLYKKEEYIYNYIPRLMTDELFYTVQDLLGKKRKIVKNNKEAPISLFDGILKCSECEGSMSRRISYTKYGNYISYRCWKSEKLSKEIGKQYKCSNKHSIFESKIEKYLLENIKKEAENYIANNKIVSVKEKESFLDNSKDIKKKLEKLKDLYLNDLIDKEMYENDYKKYNRQLQEIETKKNKYKNNTQKDFSKLEKILNTNFDDLYSSLSQIEKRRFWVSIIDKIYYNNKKIERIIFK